VARAATDPDIAIRPFAATDEPRVLELLDITLGGGPAGRRPPEFFRWKHLQNPFGSSLMLIAEHGGQVIGLRAFMRWRFNAGDRAYEAVRAVDTATHPEYQGRGVFSRLTTAALEALEGQADLVFNTPNAASRAGYLKLGWQDVGRVPIMIRACRPLRLARGLRAAQATLPPRPAVLANQASRLLQRDEEVSQLLAEAPLDTARLHTPRDLEYLRWRYGAAPFLDYHGVVEEHDGRLRGLALFRVRQRRALWESTVAEILAPAGDRRTVRRLIGKVADAAPVDHLVLRAPVVPALRSGCLPAPGGIRLVVRPIRQGIRPNPTELRAWALSAGDLEVF
jgi:GNAT superfamily N-acetyltransferase